MLREVRADFDAPILLVTHDLAECLELADQVLIYRDGRIVQAGEAKAILNAPASADVAHMLGIFNLLSVEILSLDPSRGRSRVQWNGMAIEGPYIPAHFIGDRVTLCARPADLKAFPRPSKLRPNQVAVSLNRVVNTAEGVRLDFEGVSVEMPQSEYAAKADNGNWAVEFPPHAMRAL